MAGVPTYDYETETDALKRRQALADALQQGSLSPMQLPTQPGVKVSPLEGLAKLMQGYVAGKSQDAVKADRAALTQRYGQELSTGLGAYHETSKTDPRKAILDALSTNHPALRDFAMTQMKEEAKGRAGQKDMLPYISPEAIPGFIRDGMSGFKPKANLGEVDGMVYDKDKREVLALGGPKPTFTMVNGDRMQVSPSTGAEKKLDNAPKVTNNISMNPVIKGEGEFAKLIGAQNAKAFEEAAQAKTMGQRQIQSMQKLEKLDAQGVYSGPTAKLATTVGAFAQAAGIPIDQKKLANSEAYTGEVMAGMSQYLTGSLARSTTDKDMEILKAPMPELLNSPVGRAALRRQIVAKAQEKVEYADSVHKNIASAYPEFGRLLQTAPGTVDPGQRSDISAPRRYNPVTGRIE